MGTHPIFESDFDCLTEMSGDVSQKLRLAVKSKLTSLDAFIDDELPDLILVMLARKRTKEEMIEELEPFLEKDTEKFVEWLDKLYAKLNALSGKSTGGLPNAAVKKTVARRVSSSSSSSGSSRSRSRSRTPKKRSDAFDHSGRRRHLDLAKTYRNSSSEGSVSRGEYVKENQKKKKFQKRKRSRSRSYDRRRRRSRSRTRSREKRRSYSRDRRSRSRSRNSRNRSRDSKSRSRSRGSRRSRSSSEDSFKRRRAASHERKLKIAEENVQNRKKKKGQDDGFGWDEAPIREMPPQESEADITRRLIDDELVKIEEEKKAREEEQKRLEQERELRRLEEEQRRQDREARRNRDRSKSRNRDRSRSRNRDRDRDSNRNRERDSDRNRERDSDRNRDRDSDRNRDRDSNRNRDSDRNRDRERNRDRDRNNDRELDRARDRYRDKSMERFNESSRDRNGRSREKIEIPDEKRERPYGSSHVARKEDDEIYNRGMAADMAIRFGNHREARRKQDYKSPERDNEDDDEDVDGVPMDGPRGSEIRPPTHYEKYSPNNPTNDEELPW